MQSEFDPSLSKLFVEVARRRQLLTQEQAQTLLSRSTEQLVMSSNLAVESGMLDPLEAEIVDAFISPKDLAPGYELLDVLGFGALGVVYRARQPHLQRDVAIKAIMQSRLSQQNVVARFQQEAAAIGRLQHPNIVSAYDSGSHHNRLYLVMELVQGCDLREQLEKGPLDVKTAMSVVRQTASGLAHAQSQQIIHRDIKPGNLILTDAPAGFDLPEGVPLVKIADFGLAKLNPPSELENQDTQLTLTGAALGTPMYCAPEQLTGDHVDHRADIYALGATLLRAHNHFYSALVNMGCFGIIYSVIIEVQEMELLHNEVFYKKEGWTEEFKKKFNKSFLPKPGEEKLYYYIQINPYTLKKSKQHSLIEKVITPTKNPGKGKKVRNKKFWPTVFANSGFATSIIRHISNSGRFPKRRLIESSLRSQNDNDQKGDGYTDMTYKVWNGGSGKLNSFGTAIEFAFPVKRIPGILDLLFAFLDHTGDLGRGFYFNAPIALRFVRAGKAYLAANYEYTMDGKRMDEWCYIEVLRVNSKNADDDKRELELYHHIQTMMASMGGRPHWGLNFNMDLNKDYLRGVFPKFDRWMASYNKFNSTGVFDNALTRSMKISPPVQQGPIV